jgi:hypothetical protein
LLILMHAPARKTGPPGNATMCLLCEELWMPFELPPQSKERRFIADAPEPDGVAAAPDEPSPAPPGTDPSDDAGSR